MPVVPSARDTLSLSAKLPMCPIPDPKLEGQFVIPKFATSHLLIEAIAIKTTSMPVSTNDSVKPMNAAVRQRVRSPRVFTMPMMAKISEIIGIVNAIKLITMQNFVMFPTYDIPSVASNCDSSSVVIDARTRLRVRERNDRPQ